MQRFDKNHYQPYNLCGCPLMQMYPYGTCSLVALVIAFFLLCPIILFLIPVFTGINVAFKTIKADCCYRCNALRLTNPLTYFSFIFPLQIVYAVLLAIILGLVGALIGTVAAILLTVPTQVFIVYYLCKLAYVNCKVAVV